MSELDLSDEMRTHLFAAYLKCIGEEGVKRYLKYVAATEYGTQVIRDDFDLSLSQALEKLRHMSKQEPATAKEPCVIHPQENL